MPENDEIPDEPNDEEPEKPESDKPKEPEKKTISKEAKGEALDPLSSEEKVSSSKDMRDLDEMEKKVRQLSEREKAELKANKKAQKVNKEIIEVLNSIQRRVDRLEEEDVAARQERKYGDYISLAIDELGLQEMEDKVRTNSGDSTKKAVEHWNALARKLQEEMHNYDKAIFEGETDRYNQLAEKFERMANESGDPLMQEFIEKRNMVDQKYAKTLELLDKTLMLNLLLLKSQRIDPPTALKEELREMAEEYSKEGDYYLTD